MAQRAAERAARNCKSPSTLASSLRMAPTTKLSTTLYEHQSILVTSVWMYNRTQCAPAEVKGILYYTSQDMGLGQFL
eukprot:CAMPEP_0185789768 /NCGR_PEP_ID=MMETSP1174-20130828/152742_1 /TAXON_ID=35687 /ORGANISM="Dictyocha speculum, Strain CCMP1381" /LENGTH=76 /DNA_ID=CAMNT_0028484063 /DNA_START=9 /DNA_END=236 /DNA_ORIENTATION=-